MYKLITILILASQLAYSVDKQALCDNFYLLRPNNPITIKIVCPTWDALKNEDPVNGEYSWHHATSVEISGGGSTGIPTLNDVGIKKKSTVGSASKIKPCLKLDFAKYVISNETPIEAAIGTRHLTLNNSKQDPSFMRQCLSNLYFKLAGLPYSRCNFVALYVNNVYQGIYVNVEPIETRFIKNNFRKSDGAEGDAEGNLYESEKQDFNAGTALDVKDISKYNNYLDIIGAASYINSNGVNSISNVIDLNQYNRFWAMEILLKHFDGNSWNINNTYFYNDVNAVLNPVAPNKSQINFKFIPWGTDQILSKYGWTFYQNSFLAKNLFSDLKYRWLMCGEMQKLLNMCFDPNVYYPVIEPYLDNMTTALSIIRASNPAFSEPTDLPATFDPAELKTQCRQAYNAGFNPLLFSEKFPFRGITPPIDRSIGTSPVWVEDNVPTNFTTGGNESWAWIAAPKYSKNSAHQSTSMSGMHQHYFYSYNSSDAIKVKLGAELYTYILIPSNNKPSEVMLQWYDGNTWKLAYWGDDFINWPNRFYMGPLPETGKWVRLSVPAKRLGLENCVVMGMGFTLYNGSATWDCSGVFNPAINAWVEDKIPEGSTTGGNEQWDWIAAPYNGTYSHQSPVMTGMHQHYFYNSTSYPMQVRTGAELFTYVYLDPSAMPKEIMLQWYNGGTWVLAYWGSDVIGWPNRYYMGPLPEAGKWVKLSVPASTLYLEDNQITAMGFTLFDGSAKWDASGVE